MRTLLPCLVLGSCFPAYAAADHESAPTSVRENLSRDAAEALESRLESAGAEAELR